MRACGERKREGGRKGGRGKGKGVREQEGGRGEHRDVVVVG